MRSRSDVPKRQEKEQQRTLPVKHDPVNEMVVIAAVCVDKAAADRLLPTIQPEVFFAKGHSDAWAALQLMQARGLYYDPATLTSMSGGRADAAYVDQLVRERPAAPPNLGYHVEMLLWDKRRIDGATGPVSAFLEALKDPSSDPEKVQALARSVPEAFTGFGSGRYLRDSRRVAFEQNQRLTDRRMGMATYPYGIPGLDNYADDEPDPEKRGRARMIPGSAPSYVTVLTGISGSGKSTEACWIAIANAMAKRGTCFAGWEVGSGPTLELCAALNLGWHRGDLGMGRYSEEQQRELYEEMERLGEWIKFFELPFGRARGEKNSNDRNLDLIQSVIAESHCEVFIADLMRRAFKETDPDDEEQAVYRLQAMAKEQRTHHIWLHQIRLKDLETRSDKRPTRDAMKGSSAWVEVPDTIIGVHRPALFKSIPDDKIENLILKQRWGEWPLAVEFDWDPFYGAITNGHSIDYARPGEVSDVDSLLGESTVAAPKQRGRGRPRGGRD